jgi:hypothetical protein
MRIIFSTVVDNMNIGTQKSRLPKSLGPIAALPICIYSGKKII